MKPIRFFNYRQTVWYNLADYVQLLLDTKIIWPQRPASLYKRKRPMKAIYPVLLDKLNRLNPVYRLQLGNEIYVDWVVFEHLERYIRPYLVKSDDWINPDSLIRQLQWVINRPKRLSPDADPGIMTNYFTELTDPLSSHEEP